jgi:hypothetical protein
MFLLFLASTAKALSDALEVNTTIEQVDLDANFIGELPLMWTLDGLKSHAATHAPLPADTDVMSG